MSIQQLNAIGMDQLRPSTAQPTNRISPFDAQANFAEMLKDSINNLNDAQIQSDKMTNKLINGEKVELHDVMITSQKASVSLSLSMEMRNKAVEAYQEIMRMPV